MNEFLTNTGLPRRASERRAPLYRLKSYIDNNTPVMIWATICMEPPIESDIWTVPGDRPGDYVGLPHACARPYGL